MGRLLGGWQARASLKNWTGIATAQCASCTAGDRAHGVARRACSGCPPSVSPGLRLSISCRWDALWPRASRKALMTVRGAPSSQRPDVLAPPGPAPCPCHPKEGVRGLFKCDASKGRTPALHRDFENIHADLGEENAARLTCARRLPLQAMEAVGRRSGSAAPNRAYGHRQWCGRYRDARTQNAVEPIQLFPSGLVAAEGGNSAGGRSSA